MDVDATDRKIVAALLADGRASARDISAATDVPATTVQRRLDALESAAVVDGYTADVNYAALGYGVTAVFQLSVEGSGLAAVTDRLSAHERLVDVYEVTGDHDIVAVGKFRDTDEMNAMIKEILTAPEVRTATTCVVLETVQEHTAPDVVGED